jgi:ubiquinone/menaquinone biosynthesis C-methylase UbiE
VDALDVNPGMLAVARVVASRTDPAIRWYETAAESMPLPDDAFDVVFCQLGLMFMADKAAALREMRRVLATGGRVAVSVPTPTPFFDVLEQAFARHLPAGAPFVRMVFSLDDTADIERLFNDAGFRHVLVRPVRKEMHLPPPREFLWQYVQSTPLATLAAEADPSVLAMLEHDVVAGWQPWAREGGMTYRQDLVVTTARK